ncbi:mannitol dehydrogenase family protein [Nakamurella aerolata]|uniref:mannitol dehydrogenase family protein n=1 Tax=Nakamurella aerolata TaxID=1656892 RepID=UPI003CCE02F3
MSEHPTEPRPSAPVPLRGDRLADLPPGVDRPEYDRAAVTAGIVHFGVGGFHRAHQAMYTDVLLASDDAQVAGAAAGWGICGVGVMPSDAAMRDVMRAQDGLYTLVTKAPDGALHARVIGSIVDYRYAPDDPQAVIAKLADPAVRIVSLTVTEGGYSLNQLTGEFDPSPADIQADLNADALPRTTFGLITAGLRLRRERGVPPFTVLSCDNLQGNGDLARKAFTSFATLLDPELGQWMRQQVHFPNCMVDRITPATTDADRQLVAERFGIDDGWPVVCEPFTQWVLQDDFAVAEPDAPSRPQWELTGAQIVDDVEPYELMKLRLLNASHQGIAYFGHLAGYRLVHEAATDPDLAAFLLSYMVNEASPTLAPVPGVDLDAYRKELIERFGNPGVRDTVARLAAESSDRIPKWLVPVISENIAAGRDVTLSAAICASWARYAEGVDEQGKPIDVVDRYADERRAAAAGQLRRQDGTVADPLAFVRNRDFFGDLADQPEFTEPYLAALESLHRNGSKATYAALARHYAHRCAAPQL